MLPNFDPGKAHPCRSLSCHSVDPQHFGMTTAPDIGTRPSCGTPVAGQASALRVAGCSDVEALARLKTALSSESEHMVFDVSDWQGLTVRCSAEMEAVEAGQRGVFVTEFGGMLTGYIDIHFVLTDQARVWASFDLAVRKSWRGQGLGTRLIAAAEAWVCDAGVSDIAILTAVGNASATALYRRLGYNVVPDSMLSIQADLALIGQHVLMKALIRCG